MTTAVQHHTYMSSNPSVVNVHVRCRKNFTNPSRKCDLNPSNLQSEDTVEPRMKLRSSCGIFDWHVDYLFCGKLVAEGDCVHSAMTLQIKNTVERKCAERDDDWARQVLGRVGSCVVGWLVVGCFTTHRHYYGHIGSTLDVYAV
jgi:hypothetical protein